ncbi:serine dehydratase beta chain [Streptomyces sp. NPDC096311]|uniref:serine dehydratase beta chain n=1 Tax=Streptomyces sp. NPDC096311 TaxID=3366083 RepID=UPI00381C0487
MALSAFDLYSVGIGPSSSPTVGPMRAARRFAQRLDDDGLLTFVSRVRAELFGSLRATGHGHGSDKAVVLGLEDEDPATVDTERAGGRVAQVRAGSTLLLAGKHRIGFDSDADRVLHRRKSLPAHPDGMSVIRASVERGCRREGVLPGGLRVPRPAPGLFRRLNAKTDGGDPLQVMDRVNLFALAVNEENAVEVGIEHNLGLTCDPVGGLVQIPCIERNAVASVKVINATRLALAGDGTHKVSLDQAVKTMRDTGRDMKVKYKETARGGLAVNVIEC